MNIVVLSGGTATNSLTECFNKISLDQNYELTYILPISDNGGSTSEILRVIGGPAIGDIRSRIIRLLNDKQLEKLFGYRLSNDPIVAKIEWNKIVEGSHDIWKHVSSEKKEMCRSFIIHIQSELLKRTKLSNPFKYEMASIGNLFLTGVRLFMGSLDAAIELMMRIGRCHQLLNIMPCISTNHTYHISALLKNGTVITGQSQISHPSKVPNLNNSGVNSNITSGTNSNSTSSTKLLLNHSLKNLSTTSNNSNDHLFNTNKQFYHLSNEDSVLSDDQETALDPMERHDDAFDDDEDNEEEFANPITILPELKASQLHFNKIDDNSILESPIKRILYINPYGEEIKPTGNSRAINKLKTADMIVFSIGSLMTSLLPILILGNFAKVIAERTSTKKVLLINNKYDRETYGLSGTQYVQTVVGSMRKSLRNYEIRRNSTPNLMTANSSSSYDKSNWSRFVTDIIYLKQGEIEIDEAVMKEHGITCHSIESNIMDNKSLQELLIKINSEN
ncbi:hypothetical protein TBLA_0C01310 [Henningerozyma blattae CBS 6284]|uniref:Uncharacterized protein n=1 Tax=Henningerozyma blattae (strain ATCC 34711 / CBS 6284 / DSM 70876 / NBRC 10599 / NRRL Y-10934 / UCD 77-7) TaxID=1071380 RepID=I2H0P4_HENB6|nr:hypothetical protein TBLA_0C01310 [Tetrapisispora blattae CBS 6284]CCH59946.1 hypothetical protein TBLA_0C01310 [Tetrapisispora blattae CBS 6284]